MRRDSVPRILLTLVVAVLLMLVWPAFSLWWTQSLRTMATVLVPGGIIKGPSAASPTLPVVIAVLVGFPLTWRKKSVLVAGAFVSALCAEALGVVVGSALALGSTTMNLLAGLAQDVVPLAWLLYGVVLGQRRRA